MMELDINNLPTNLHIVNEFVAKYIKEGCLSFEEKLRLMYFFKDYGNIGSMFIPEEVKQIDVHDLPITASVAKETYAESQKFLKLYRDNRKFLDEFEVKTDCDNFLAPFVQKWETAKEYSQKVHQEYIDLDNRLSYIDERDPSHAELLKRCYELYDQQKEAGSIAKNARMELEKARCRLYGLENFNFKWLNLLVSEIYDTIYEIFPKVELPNKEELL